MRRIYTKKTYRGDSVAAMSERLLVSKCCHRERLNNSAIQNESAWPKGLSLSANLCVNEWNNLNLPITYFFIYFFFLSNHVLGKIGNMHSDYWWSNLFLLEHDHVSCCFGRLQNVIRSKIQSKFISLKSVLTINCIQVFVSSRVQIVCYSGSSVIEFRAPIPSYWIRLNR